MKFQDIKVGQAFTNQDKLYAWVKVDEQTTMIIQNLECPSDSHIIGQKQTLSIDSPYDGLKLMCVTCELLKEKEVYYSTLKVGEDFKFPGGTNVYKKIDIGKENFMCYYNVSTYKVETCMGNSLVIKQ